MLCAPVNWKSLVREKERKRQQFMSQFSRSGLLGTSPSTNEGKCSFIRTWPGGWCCRSNPRASYCQFAGLCGFSVGKDIVQTWCNKMKSQRAGQMGHVPCSGDEGSMGDGQMRLATKYTEGQVKAKFRGRNPVPAIPPLVNGSSGLWGWKCTYKEINCIRLRTWWLNAMYGVDEKEESRQWIQGMVCSTCVAKKPVLSPG